MKLLVDMNLTPEWVGFLAERGIEAEHWSNLGRSQATNWRGALW